MTSLAESVLRGALSDRGSFQLSPIKAIELAAAKIPGAVSLAQGIPSFRTPQAIKDYVTEQMRLGLTDKYSLTTGLTELREEISSSLSKEGLRYDPDSEILVTAGSIEGITASLLANTQAGDEVLLPSPTYASYLGAIGVARCIPKFFELDEENNFDFQIERIARAITPRTKVLLYCSPNNPTGTLFSEENTRALIALADQHDLTVLIDEVYKDFYYTADKHFTPCSIPEARDRVIRVCSFSKAYAMTGWRVGFLHSAKHRVSPIVKYHDAMVTCAPVISQYAAIAALRFCDDYLREFKDEFKRRRDFTIERLDCMSHALDYQLPKATYFVFPRVKDLVPMARDSTRLAYDILEKSKLALVPGIAFGPSGEQHLRISYGREWEDLREGLTRLEEYFNRSLGERRRIEREAPSKKPTRSKPLMRSLAQLVLGSAAKFWVHRNRPTVVAIAGIRGKTVIKRSIVESLRSWCAARGSVLSYNTELGLPLSILNVPLLSVSRSSPFKEKLALLTRIVSQSFSKTKKPEVLVLEYGVESATDAKRLSLIAKPDWLVIAPLGDADPGLDVEGIREGVLELVRALPADRVLWPAEDAWIAASGLMLDAKNALHLPPTDDGSSTTGAVGESAHRGLAAGKRLCQLLGLSHH